MLQLIGLAPLTLAPCDLAVAPGECVAIQGPSGSGKTLLLRAIADLDPCAGEIRLDDRAATDVSGPEWRRRVTYVAAESGWWLDRVGDHFRDWEVQAEAVRALGLPPACGEWSVERLSTGERQRLALLRALELAPRVLLLDEPTSGLDDEATAAVEDLVRARCRDGLAVIWVTHNGAQAARVARRTLRIADGRLEAA